jgi:hypothetical protein
VGLGLGVARGRRRADAHGSFREPNPRGMRIAPQAVGAVRCVRRASFDSARASRLCRDTRAEVDLNPVPYLLTDADVRLIEGRRVADGSGFLPRPRARRNKNCGALRFSRVSLKRYVFPDRSEKLWHVHTARARPARAMTFARLWRQLTRWGDIQTPAADIGTPGLPEQKDDAHTSSWWVSSEDLAGEIPTPAWDAVPLDIGTPPPPTPEDTETIPYQVISFILSSGWRDIPAPTRENDPRAVSQQGAIPGLPDHVVSAHILGNMSDPLDIARVLAVSRGMRDAVPVKARAQPHSTGCKACTAVSRGYLNTAKHLHAKGKLQCPTIHCQDCFMENMCALAASNGQLRVLEWALFTLGCRMDERTCASAARNGHLTTLKFAKENGCPWNSSTCEAAAAGGHLLVLEWARENGCPWNERTCWHAAKFGNLAVLQWARENGCPWDGWTYAKARKGGHVRVVRWARANGAHVWMH